ncbi:MAG: hypothetical protein ABIQ35_01280 [Verrucomicrobiota bacterium]
MKFIFLSLVLLIAGCATNNTFEKRRTERSGAYSAFSPEIKTLVDKGEIKVGMPEDAVYIAWGPPAEILKSENERGAILRWLYYGSYLQEQRYWTGSRGGFARGYPSERLEFDYIPRDYVSAEIIFANGVVKSWTMRPRPL